MYDFSLTKCTSITYLIFFAMKIHSDSPHITIGFDSLAEAVVLQWKRLPIGSEDFRSALNAGLDLLVEQKSSHWLADVRNMGFIQVEDQDWTNQDWFPRAASLGIRKMALILTQQSIAHASTNRIMRRVNGIVIETAMFDNETDAKRWLARTS
jgi:hypothetical protein